MAALRPDKFDGLTDEGREVARLPTCRPRPTQVEEALDVRLQERELTQGHFQRDHVDPAFDLREEELDREAGTRQPVAELMRQPAGHLPEDAQALGLLDRLLELQQLARCHLVDRPRQVADLVVAARQRHRTEVPGG